MDHYFTVQHSYQVGVLRYDNLCCTVNCYYSFSLHDMVSFVVIFPSPHALGCSALSIAMLLLCITLEFY